MYACIVCMCVGELPVAAAAAACCTDCGMCMHVCICVCSHVCMCMYVCMYVCGGTAGAAAAAAWRTDCIVCMCACMYMPACICLHICIYQNWHTYINTYKADCVRVCRRRSPPKGKSRFEPFENCVFRVAQTWLNGIFPSPREFCGQLKRNQLYTHNMWRHDRTFVRGRVRV